MILSRPLALLRSLTAFANPSGPGLLVGAIFLAMALAPSLIPRTGLVQGALAGAAFPVGYLVGSLSVLLWQLLGLRQPPPEKVETIRQILAALSFALILWALSQATGWQDRLHQALDLPPVESARPFTIAFAALLTATLFILIARLFRRAVLAVAHRLSPLMPERLALVIGFLSAVLLFDLVANDVLLSRVLAAMDSSYQRVDEYLPASQQPPRDPLRSGSAASLLDWQHLGAEGRNRINDPLDAATIEGITGAPAQEPLRIYVGLGSAETPEERAQLALAEALRTDAFSRGTLVIVTPTGTGWVDPASMLPLEVLTGGDVATISVQYSYLPSWLSLLTVPEYGNTTARAVFAAIHGHWKALPPETRPKLYLNGLSLGAMNSDLSADFFDLIADPYDGAFWIGPPFTSRLWNQVTTGRQPESPAWLPRFRDGSVVRFLDQTHDAISERPWGPMRILYLQYATDPITFFSPSIAWREPDWMRAPRGPGVIPEFRWMPLVTFLQVGFDVMTATLTPKGHGHVYSARDYLRGWQAMLDPPGWSDAQKARLLAEIDARGL